MASSDVVTRQQAPSASPPTMRTRPRLPDISYINRQQDDSVDRTTPQLFASSTKAESGSGNELNAGETTQQSVLQSDFAQKFRRPLGIFVTFYYRVVISYYLFFKFLLSGRLILKPVHLLLWEHWTHQW